MWSNVLFIVLFYHCGMACLDKLCSSFWNIVNVVTLCNSFPHCTLFGIINAKLLWKSKHKWTIACLLLIECKVYTPPTIMTSFLGIKMQMYNLLEDGEKSQILQWWVRSCFNKILTIFMLCPVTWVKHVYLMWDMPTSFKWAMKSGKFNFIVWYAIFGFHGKWD